MDSFWSNIFRRSEDNTVFELLRDIPLFDGLSPRELEAVTSILHRREYDADEVLFRQTNPGVGMYIIQEGSIDIIFEPTQTTLATLEDGDFFGELALLNDSPRSATAIARRSSVLYGLFRPDLLGLIDRKPSLGVEILLRMSRVISERLIRSNNQLQSLRKELAREREDAALGTSSDDINPQDVMPDGKVVPARDKEALSDPPSSASSSNTDADETPSETSVPEDEVTA